MKGFVTIAFIIVIAVIAGSYAQRVLPHPIKPPVVKNIPHPPAKTVKQTPVQTDPIFPLEKDHVYSLYTYIIDLKNEKVTKKYKHLFAKYNYRFTAYVWMGVLEHIISDCPDKDIAQNTFVKPQGDLVGFSITRYKAISKFPAFICPILSDTKLLEHYIKTADRNKIHNF